MTSPKNKSKSSKNKFTFLFDMRSYQLMAAGVVLMVIGYILMSGGASDDPSVYPADQIFSFRRITLAPILIVAGVLLEIYAILRKRNDAK